GAGDRGGRRREAQGRRRGQPPRDREQPEPEGEADPPPARPTSLESLLASRPCPLAPGAHNRSQRALGYSPSAMIHRSPSRPGLRSGLVASLLLVTALGVAVASGTGASGGNGKPNAAVVPGTPKGG